MCPALKLSHQNCRVCLSATVEAQQQAELAELSGVLLISALDTPGDDGGGYDVEGSDDNEEQWWLPESADNVMEIIAARALAVAEAMSGDGSRGPYDGIPRSKDYFAACNILGNCNGNGASSNRGKSWLSGEGG